jgi:hypothetical protein
MDKWAPLSTRAWGVRPPYPWRMHWGCAMHSVDTRGAPHIHAPRICVGLPSGKGGRHIRGVPLRGAPWVYISMEHHFEVRHGYVVPTTIKVPSPYLPLQAPTVMNVRTYQAYDINGYTFYTEKKDHSSEHQNSAIARSESTSDNMCHFWRNNHVNNFWFFVTMIIYMIHGFL